MFQSRRGVAPAYVEAPAMRPQVGPTWPTREWFESRLERASGQTLLERKKNPVSWIRENGRGVIRL
jgi:hypothetical protein